MRLTDPERLAVRERPKGQPVMHQSWGKLLFMHWRIDAEALRPLIPSKLEIDTFAGSAWIAIAPFTMWNTRVAFLPPVPGLSAMHELNVRTYVHFGGVPGVWFFSLDCNSSTVVWGARTFFYLPYYNADIRLDKEGQTIDYSLVRTDKPAAKFHAVWTKGEPLPCAAPGSLEFFLTERYCLYSYRAGELYRSRIHHASWPLQSATLLLLTGSMIEAVGLPTPRDTPLLHYAEEIKVDIWSIRKVSAAQ